VAVRRSAQAFVGEEDDHRVAALGNGRIKVLAEFELPSTAGSEREVMDRVAAAVDEIGLPGPRLEKLKTAVSEAAMNAIEHGNDEDADLKVGVQVLVSPEDLRVLITDQGGGNEIPEVEVPDIEAKIAGLQKPRGWGLFLIENMVDKMEVTSDDRHHTVELVLFLTGEEARPLPSMKGDEDGDPGS
jgi:anti-sigma regulatory factor (Ser/Thr protein kinase)